MNQTIHCPKCASANVIFSKKRGIHVCEDCDHEFTPKKPFVPKRLFLSYGHDEHVSLAIRLRDDLRTRGHAVWFDEERLQPGHDWEAFIEKGLEDLAADKANAAVVLLLTPHSVRRPDGYCLNEVARALSRGLRIVPLMVVESEPPLSICRIQWLDMRQCIPIHEKEAIYRPRFERLLKALEDDQLDFEGTQQRLLKTLQPLEFDADILQHVGAFTGRQWVFDAIQAWLAPPSIGQPPKARVFWICGGPGVGKTAISAMLGNRYLEVAALHLCKFGHAQKSDPRRVVTSIAYQLSTQLPEYEARLAKLAVENLAQDDAASVFDNLIVQPLTGLSQPPRTVIILIDALDEATNRDWNALANFIGTSFIKTPEWMRLIVTSRRPDSAVDTPLQGLRPFILNTEIEDNLADIRTYVLRELSPQLAGRSDAARLVAEILAQSEGVFLYAERVCREVLCGNLSLDRLDEFPRGLGNAFLDFFHRLVWVSDGERSRPDYERYAHKFRPPLRAIIAAREGLPTRILKRLFNWKEDELADFVRSLGALFPVSKQGGEDIIRPYHKAVADWIADQSKAGPYYVSVTDGHALLAEAGMEELQSAYEHPATVSSEEDMRPGTMDIAPYWVLHTPYHLKAAGRKAEAETVANNQWSYKLQQRDRGFPRVFACYSFEDRHIVENLVHAGELVGLRYLHDPLGIGAGEDWNMRLKQLISDADVFQLLWSRSAMRSQWVRVEWEFALSLDRPGFIRPVYFEQPIPQIPPELMHIHFQYLPTIGTTGDGSSISSLGFEGP